MTERTAVPDRVTRRAKTARRGGSGAHVVGDFVGQPAGEAAKALRRAGLRPGLDRSFGCPAELVGLVVAQEPAAGSDLARNGMVMLYVAAPGSEPDQDDTAPSSQVDPQGEPHTPTPAEAAPTAHARRRRKRGLAQRAAVAVEPPPTPVRPGHAAGEPALPSPVEAPGEWPPAFGAVPGALEDEPTGELGEQELMGEKFVVRVEDVLAGHSGPTRWRGVYRRRRAARRPLGGQGRVSGWLREHRVLGGLLAGMLALWALVGVLTATDGHHAPARASASAASARHRSPAPKHPTVQPPEPPKTSARPARTDIARRAAARPRPRHARAPRPARSQAPAVGEAAPAATPAPPPTQQPSVAAVQRTNAPAVPDGEQRGGGLFSP